MDYRAGVDSEWPIRLGAKEFGRPRECQLGMLHNQQRLGSGSLRDPRSEIAYDYRGGTRFQRQAQVLFIFDKNQVFRGRLRDARDTADLYSAITQELRL